MDEKNNYLWLKGAEAAASIIEAAQQTGNWDVIDGLAQLLEIGTDPYQQGAWEVLVEELSRRRRGVSRSRSPPA